MKKENVKQTIEKKICSDKIITEYVETGEGDGISIIPLKELETDVDGKVIIRDNIDNTKENQ